jgi:DNA mismatch repair ATPase MutS
MRHPCVVWDCILNDVLLHDQSVLILTYPNASGQSTFARICCVAVIHAQLGCYLPAEEAVLMVFDEIFT